MENLSLVTVSNTDAVRQYIKDGWRFLRRGHNNIILAIQDPKAPVGKAPTDKEKVCPIYVSQQENAVEIQEKLRNSVDAHYREHIIVKPLPDPPYGNMEFGYLYLPHNYVVPGGRFNEMYGWDSYFINLGLIEDKLYHLAQQMIDNLLYQIEHYGTILNSNRTYYLTRSQPPFLGRMILELHAVHPDKKWLSSTLEGLKKLHAYWQADGQKDAETGLSKYTDSANGPAAEVIASEVDEHGKTHYCRVADFFREHGADKRHFDNNKLTDAYYKADRAMRASGFDVSCKFGAFNGNCHETVPVCLNTLLYRLECDIAEIISILGGNDSQHSQELDWQDQHWQDQHWQELAAKRKNTINTLLWNAEHGQYFDYDTVTKQQFVYPYLTTFYPLWAGIATSEQAAAVVKNIPLFLEKGGLMTSTQTSGNQWDAPFGWAPLQYIAVEGLRRYGFDAEATEIARRFTQMILNDFEKCKVLLEKYDVIRASGNVADEIHFGYESNEVGFGWTNGVLLKFMNYLN